jgi:hypothetical protein
LTKSAFPISAVTARPIRAPTIDALAAQGVRYTGKPWMASMSAGRKWRGNKVATQVERRNEHTEWIR